jgi:adenylate cyclase
VVVTRRGDVFGTTVNLASRLTAVARPDSVLVDGITADALAESAAYRLRPLGPRAVRGIGLVRPVVLERR